MNIKIAICDDMEYFADQITLFSKSYARLRKKDIEISCFTDPQKLLKQSEVCRYDIILLDIEMPELDGITLAKMIKEKNEDILIIFITSHPQFAYAAAQVEAIGYITKPAKEEQFTRLMDRAVIVIQGLQEQKLLDQQFLEVIVDYEKMHLYFKDIAVIEKYNNSVIITTKNGREYKYYITLKKIEEKLNRKRFIKINNSCFIHIIYVKEILEQSVIMSIAGENKYYSISRKAYTAVKSELQRYLAKKRSK